MAAAKSHEDSAREILEGNRYMVLSTSDLDRSPWAAVVYYAYSSKYEFYFLSAMDARHSENISANPKVSFVIFDSNQPMGRAESIQAEGTATLMPFNEALKEAIKIYSEKQFPDSKMDPLKRYPPSELAGTSSLRFYRIKVKEMYISGTKNRRYLLDLKLI